MLLWRLSSTAGGNNNDTGVGNEDQEFDTSQAVVSAAETAAAQSKWTPARGHICNWGSETNRKQFYANMSADGKKRLCDAKGCNKPLSNKRYKAVVELQARSDRKNAGGKYFQQEKPFGPSNDPEPEPEPEPHTNQEGDDSGNKDANMKDQLELKRLELKLLEARAFEEKLKAENAQLARQVRQGEEDGYMYGTSSSWSSSSGSIRQRRGRGSHQARAIIFSAALRTCRSTGTITILQLAQLTARWVLDCTPFSPR